jgi:hypothetical protein
MKRVFSVVIAVILLIMPLIAAIPAAGASEEFYDVAELLEIKSHIEKQAGMSSYATVQGACTDGRYAYFAVQESGTVILKYDVRTWQLVKKAAVAGLGHANDMTYNSKEEYLVVANNNVTDDVVTLVNPKTLKVIKSAEPTRERPTESPTAPTVARATTPSATESRYVNLRIYSIAYNSKLDRYVAGISGKSDFAILDKDFKLVKQFSGLSSAYTHQGCDCDDDYIYFPQSGGDNVIVVYNYKGKHVATLSMGHSHEVENLFHVGDTFYTTLHYYGNSVHRVGLSNLKEIRFSVVYEPDGGYGSMAATSVHYGVSTPLMRCAFEKPGYFFGGWCARRAFDGKVLGYRNGASTHEWLDEDQVYRPYRFDNGAAVAKLTPLGSVTMTAFWINERYGVYFDSDGGEGWMEPMNVGFDESFALPENTFIRHGYIFGGYTVSRDYDGRVYGYRRGSDNAEWLEPADCWRRYTFAAGDRVRKLTYDGSVTFTAKFRFAYEFDESGETLLSYVGLDSRVDIPNERGRLNTIAAGAFTDNTTMSVMLVPAGVENVERGAIDNCIALREIYFDGGLPHGFDREAIRCGSAMIYEVRDGVTLCLGLCADRWSADLIKLNAASFEKHYALWAAEDHSSAVIE